MVLFSLILLYCCACINFSKNGNLSIDRLNKTIAKEVGRIVCKHKVCPKKLNLMDWFLASSINVKVNSFE
jgi:hypothetical protein